MIAYFAYGSNMLPQRLQRRCPSARISTTATLQGYELEFSKIGQDGSGKATIVPSARTGARVFGAVFYIAPDDIAVLDGFEGRGKGYERHENFRVHATADHQALAVNTYIAESDYLDARLQPFDWYLALVLNGARCTGLPEHYCRRIAATPAGADPVPLRRSRQEALAVLAEAANPINRQVEAESPVGCSLNQVIRR